MSDFLAAVARALRFWSRLPLPALPFETDPHARLSWPTSPPRRPSRAASSGSSAPWCSGLPTPLGLPPLVAAVLAAAALVVITGAMHEDALGDVADGFGGGRTVAAKLEIMKDPRLGSYGACALVLALALRIALLAGLLEALGPWRAGAAMIAAAALARIAGLWPLAALPPARSDGIGATAARSAARHGCGVRLWRSSSRCRPAGLPRASPARSARRLAPFSSRRSSSGSPGGRSAARPGDVCGTATVLAELAALGFLLAARAG